jgi:hypothetical protein
VRTKLSFLFLVFILAAGCKKENYETKPKLEIENIKVFEANCNGSNGGFIEIDMNVLDKEGDVTDSIFIQKVDAAQNPCPANSILKNLDYKIPEYPIGNTQKVLFRIKFSTTQCLGYALIGGSQCLQKKDTSLFKFWVKDIKGNVSDTLITAPIAIP